MWRKLISLVCFAGVIALAADVSVAGVAYSDPAGGWRYIYTGDGAAGGDAHGTQGYRALDGTWSHQGGSDSWDGTPIGSGQAGGILALSEGGANFLRVQDAHTYDPSAADPDSRKVYFAHSITTDMGAATAATILDSGVTISFRARLSTTPPLDSRQDSATASSPWPAGGEGYVVHDGGKGSFGIRQSTGDKIISFALVLAGDVQGEPKIAGRSGLCMNNRNGTTTSGTVDIQGNEAGTLNLLDIAGLTVWHEFWITIQADTSGGGTHKVSVYIDGSVTPIVFHVTAGDGNDYDDSYMGLGVGATGQCGAIDVDFLAYKEGVIAPSGKLEAAQTPNPADKAADVSQDVILKWKSGIYAAKHDVYFGTVLDTVKTASRTSPVGVLAGPNQDANSYDPVGLLEYGKTYYWRIDEIRADGTTIDKGEVWSFTVEPVAYAIKNITAAASSSHNATTGPEKTVDGSGINASDQHGVTDTAMWLSSGTGSQPAWIQYTFDKTYKLHEMWVWNYNQSLEPFVGFGLKNVTLQYSTDGTNWPQLAGVPDFAQGTGLADYVHNTTVAFAGVAAKYVKITVNSNWGTLKQCGLSEVRFFYMPVQAKEPNPPSGQTEVALDTSLGWKSGREAATHKLYLSTSKKAVREGTVVPISIPRIGSQASYGPLSLELGKMYFWKVDEVNEAKTPSTWQGDIWSFTAKSFSVVDDFEDYNNSSPKRIFQTWIDGYGYSEPAPGNPGNGTGSAVGHDIWSAGTPYTNIMETTIIHGGRQAMPMDYNNVRAPYYSEAERTFTSPQDWTTLGIKALTLWFRGNAPALAESAGKYTMGASGTDIYNTADQFRFAYKRLSGNGTIIAQVLSVQNTDPWAKAGVMIRDTLDPGSKFAMVIMAPANGCRYQIRTTLAGGATSDSAVTTLAGVRVPHWVKLERTGDSFKAYDSNDPATDGWHELVWGAQTITMQTDVYIGLCLTSHNANAQCIAEFANVSTTGNVTGAIWQQQAIGVAMPSNAPEQLYVVVQDSTGKNKVVNHSDPASTILATWQEWNIPLKTFSDAGVNLKSVKKLSIGAGKKAAPVLGGAGSLYFDDIRLYPPRCLPAVLKPAADITSDCAVDYADVKTMASQWLQTVTPPATLSADLTADSKVDLKDFAKLAQGWLEELLWP